MKASSSFTRRIGACPKCMHESFLAAVGSWGACFAVGIVGEVGFRSDIPFIAAAIIAGLLSLLWLLHLAVFAARAGFGFGNRRNFGSAPTRAGALLLRRRDFISRFAAAFAGAALATSLFPRHALAQQQWYACGGTSCGGNACCPASQPILNQCDCQCYQSSSDFNNCSSYTQCALDGSNCS